MTTTLITFLGRVPKHEGSYRATRYIFPDGTRTEPVAFFGWPLQDRLGCERLVILGTPGSMWDHLFEGDLALGETAERQRLELIEAVERKSVERAHLASLEPVLGGHLGIEVSLRLIPYARDEAEQVELLRVLASAIPKGGRAHIDVTHGFRHLPMLALLSALHLRQTKNALIEGIWYGAFDPDTGSAPVHELSGLLHIADWIEALSTFDKDGDYGVFAERLGTAGEPLRRAAFFERTTNPVKAREALAAWREPGNLSDPAYDLFREELHRRIAWRKGTNRADWERDLARAYLERGDYLRAALYAVEGCISHAVRRAGGDMNQWEAREQARKQLLEQNTAGFRTLNHLRNAMAHGVCPKDKKILRAIGEEANLRSTLKSLFTQLFD